MFSAIDDSARTHPASLLRGLVDSYCVRGYGSVNKTSSVSQSKQDAARLLVFLKLSIITLNRTTKPKRKLALTKSRERVHKNGAHRSSIYRVIV